MRLHRFFIEQSISGMKGKEMILSDTNLVHQWRNVFRYTAGSFLILLDNSGHEVMGQIESISIKGVKVHIVEERENKTVPKKELFIFQSLIKKDRFEWEIEKLTELGVSHIIPIISERSEKKNLHIERCQKILKEASEQCGRGTIPKIYAPCDLDNTASFQVSQRIAFHIDGAELKKEVYEKEQSLGIYIGPEGGWGGKDISFFEKENIPVVSLGTATLRAETAGLAISTLFLL